MALEPGPGTMLFIYDETGRGRYTIEWPYQWDMGFHLPEGTLFVIAPKGLVNAFYVDLATGEACEKQTMELSSSGTAAVGETVAITGIPVPAKVLVDGVTYDVDDGQIDFTPETTGTYTFVVKAVPYYDGTITVTVE